ncbi:MAG: glycosyltransferase family 9 protein [Vicingaceae bacterium]
MNPPVKILIIRFSSIGDIVLTTPVIRCLKKQVDGEAEIHFLTKKAYAPLVAENPYLSKVYTIEKSTNEVIEELQAEGYDYVVDLHKNMRARRVKSKLKAFSFTFDKLNFKKWLLVNFKWDRMPDIHIVDRYLASVKALGIEKDENGLDYFLPENFKPSISLPYQKGNYVVLVLGANHGTKKIPESKMQEILAKSKQSFVLLGGKEDQVLGDQLAQLAPERIFNAAGKTTLHESAYLIKDSKSVITPDTGMMHIAAAFQKPIVSLWGNTVPELGMYPYYEKGKENRSTVFEVKGLSCRPCSKIGFKKCPKGHFKCMMEIESEAVVSSIGNI